MLRLRPVVPGLLGLLGAVVAACSTGQTGTGLGLENQGGDGTSSGSSTSSGSGSTSSSGSGGASSSSSSTSSSTSSGNASSSSSSSGSGGASSSSSSSSSTSSTSSASSSSSGDPSCPAGGLVYTLDEANNLYTFDPPTLTFTLVGTLNCPTFATPYSMAVSRTGDAYSVFTDGSLFKIDTKTAACVATAFVPGQQGFTEFGMGFSANSPGSMDETLYVSQADFNGTTIGLGKIDLGTMTLTKIGMYDQLNARAELTGTANAQLFGAFEGSPYDVAEIDKTNAKILSQAPQAAINYPPGSSNFAFAYWGGDFWLFVGPGSSTDVFHYVPASSTTTNVKSVPYIIVGAGVSICAPTHM